MGSGVGKPVVTPAATTLCYAGAGPSRSTSSRPGEAGEGRVTGGVQAGEDSERNHGRSGSWTGVLGGGSNSVGSSGSSGDSRSSSQQSDYGEAVDENCNMVCEACATNFHVFKRKYRCTDCDRYYCSNCFIKDPRKYCSACSAVSQSPTRADLMSLKIKDLRLYLNTHSVSTQACREKDELVDLVQQYVQAHPHPPARSNTSRASSSSSANNRSSTTGQQQQRSRTNQQQQQQQQQNSGQRVTQRLEEMVQDIFSNIANPMRESSVDPPNFTQDSTSDASGSGQGPQSRQAWTRQNITTTYTTPTGTQTTTQTHYNTQPTPDSTPQSNGTNASEDAEQQTPVQPMRKRGSLSDIDTAEGIESLSVKQLKEILTTNFVDYKGCVERWELQERVRRLYDEKQQRKKKEEDKTTESSNEGVVGEEEDEAALCKICMDAAIDCVLLECGHMVTCTACGKRMNECPICRQYVIRAVHIFRA